MAKIRPTKPLWVGIPEAARLLNRDRRTIERLIADGKLRSRDDLGQTLVWYADIETPRGEQTSSHGSWCSSDSDPDAGDQQVLEVGA